MISYAWSRSRTEAKDLGVQAPLLQENEENVTITATKKAHLAESFIDSKTLASKKFASDWLVESLLVADQPAVIGGQKKTLKTTLSIDMAISLATGTPFLGKFRVPTARKVAVVSGESGKATVQETASRIALAKKVKLADCSIFWSFRLPRLDSLDDRKELKIFLAANKINVVFIDPLYLCLLGRGRASAANLYEVGPVLYHAANACLTAGATPVFLHHATKGSAKRECNGPLDLDDLAFSGIGEFARQWLLLNRREPFQIGSGSHKLWLAAGGSAGHSGCWQADIDEGTLAAGRKWSVKVDARSGGASRGSPHLDDDYD